MAISKSKEYRKELAEMFAKLLEEKELDWKKEWKGLANVPVNAVRERKYKGINAFALMLTMMERGYTDPRFATFNQIKEMGCKLHDAKGMGIRVEYWFPYDKEEKKALTWEEFKLLSNGKPNERYVLHTKYSTVFNAAHIEGLPERRLEKTNDISSDELIEKLAENMGVEIVNDGGDRAFYRLSEDKIHLPVPEAFSSDYAYNSTALHELAHSTGAPHRLNRKFGGTFGSESYAYEELIAEITSCFMSVNLNLEQDEIHLDNHKAYIQSWIKGIREKPESLAKAIAEAEKIVSYMEYKAELISEYEYQQMVGTTMELTVNEETTIQEETLPDDYAVARLVNTFPYTTMQGFDVELTIEDMQKIHQKYKHINLKEYLKENHIDWSDDKLEEITREVLTLISKYDYTEEDAIEAAVLNYKERISEKKTPLRLLVDLDGTAVEFKPVDTLETLYEEGYFLNLRPNENVVAAVNNIIHQHPEIEVYVMSSVLTDSKYALKEKNEWIDMYLPQIDKAHRVFPPCGENKLDYVPGGVRTTDHLLDDYTKNLVLWEPPAKAIKLLNGINHTHQTWRGNMLRYDKSANEIADDIVRIMKDKVLIQDKKPQQSPAQSIMHELKEIRDELLSIQESLHITRGGMNEEKKNLTLEERYTEAMTLAGYVRTEEDMDSPMTLHFVNPRFGDVIDVDGWEMLGQELEWLHPWNEDNRTRFEELIHPKERVSYYVSNVLKMSNLTEEKYDVTLHNNLESAIKEYILDGLALGYVVDDEKFELASFDAVSMKHSYGGVNWRQFPKLTQNEISKVKDNLSYLKYALQKENTYHAMTEGFTDIAINSALSEMVKNNDLWGSWLGRVANTHRPQDYLDINITGYRYHNQVTCEVLVIHANEIQDAKEMTIHVDPDNFTESLQEGMSSILTEFSQFLADSIDLLATDMGYHMQSYHRNGIHTLDEHYEQLENRGYASEADRSEYFSTKNKFKKHMTKESDSSEAEEKKESKNVIQQTTRKPKI